MITGSVKKVLLTDGWNPDKVMNSRIIPMKARATPPIAVPGRDLKMGQFQHYIATVPKTKTILIIR